jgi:CheY-like chemotaxis protein
MENPTLDREIVVLLAEEDPAVRLMLERLLKQGGYDLLVAADGQEALQKSDEHKGRIDILVADVQMPGMTGADLAKEIRRSRTDLRIILLSAVTQGLLVLDSTWHFIQKPFLAKALLERIVDVVKKPPSPHTDRGLQD